MPANKEFMKRARFKFSRAYKPEVKVELAADLANALSAGYITRDEAEAITARRAIPSKERVFMSTPYQADLAEIRRNRVDLIDIFA
jgi:hypothetical protein